MSDFEESSVLDPHVLEPIWGALPDGLTVQDLEGRVVFANEAAASLLGVGAPADVLAVTPAAILERFELLDHRGEPCSLESLPGRAAMRGDRPAPMVVGFRARANGTLRWSLVRAWPVMEAGVVRFVVNLFHEITDERRSEEALRFLADASAMLATSLDTTTTLQAVARLAVPRLADWCAIDVVETPGTIRQLAVAHVDPTKVGLARELNQRYPLQPDAPTGVPHVIRTGKAELYPEISDEMLQAGARDEEHLRITRELGLRAAMIIPLNARGRTLGALTLVSAESRRRFDKIDVACAEELGARAALAMDNARLYDAAQRAIRSRDDLMATVSHDLRSPLDTILLSAELLRAEDGSEADPREVPYLVATIRRAAKRMEVLIRDLLDIASIESGHLRLDPAPVTIGSLFQEALEAALPEARAKHVRMEADVDDAGIRIHCDKSRILQVFANLAGNAIKFTPSGGSIVIGAQPKGDHVVFTLRDTGLGISEEQLPHVFDRFWRARQASVVGVGLGLAICQSIVKQHGGRIWVESTLGQGTMFSFTLPIYVPDPPSA